MKKILLGIVTLLCMSVPALAANCAAYPYTLTNGQTADANQVMADFNNILSCGNTALLGVNNNLSDLNNAATARTNLGLGASAVEGLSNTSAGAVVDDGAGNLVTNHVPTLQVQQIASTGSFTVPATATAATVFKITCLGGGGGGGGQVGGADPAGGGGGGSGAYAVAWFSGFTPSSTVSISIGTGGTGGTDGNANGGSATSVSYASVAVMTCNGGAGGHGGNGGAIGGAPGSASVTAGASGLTLSTYIPTGAQPGGMGVAGFDTSIVPVPGVGGGNPLGSGGAGNLSSNGSNGSNGGGGSGASNGTSSTGGTGASGIVMVEWVL